MPHGARINICAQNSVEGVLITVEDTGPGIPDHVRDRLFEPFVTCGKPDGLGLGLALARQTLRSRGGDIWTEPATGARVVIRLPVERAQRAIAGHAALQATVTEAAETGQHLDAVQRRHQAPLDSFP